MVLTQDILHPIGIYLVNHESSPNPKIFKSMIYYLLCQVIGKMLQEKYKYPIVKVYFSVELTFSKCALVIVSMQTIGKKVKEEMTLLTSLPVTEN